MQEGKRERDSIVNITLTRKWQSGGGGSIAEEGLGSEQVNHKKALKGTLGGEKTGRAVNSSN